MKETEEGIQQQPAASQSVETGSSQASPAASVAASLLMGAAGRAYLVM